MATVARGGFPGHRARRAGASGTAVAGAAVCAAVRSRLRASGYLRLPGGKAGRAEELGPASGRGPGGRDRAEAVLGAGRGACRSAVRTGRWGCITIGFAE